jgi:phosphate transport system permease protein
MTIAAPAPQLPGADDDVPRSIDPGRSFGDLIFQNSARAIGGCVLVLIGSIGLFLGYQAIPTLHRYGWHFLTESQWNPEQNVVGIASATVGTIQVAVIALVVAFPLALLTALFISEYAPRRLKSWLVSLVDLMAAVPSIVYGLWGVGLLQPHALYVARFISRWFGWIPIFKVEGASPTAAAFSQHSFALSPFIAGLAVAMMVIPLSCAVMRNVFSQAPLGEREAALALGSTRWGMIRAVVLPFGRGGIIGGTMLGLGRALGETIVVLLIISPVYKSNFHILQAGGNSISALIADPASESSSFGTSALMAAGLALFALTLVVNFVASSIVARSRSGAESEV